MISTIQPKPCHAQPVKPARGRRWLLTAAIALEAAWVLLLLAMTLAR
jgi:hypothetical protein